MGIDSEFGCGSLVMNCFNGDVVVFGDNFCFGFIGKLFFYVLKVVLVDLVGSGGLSCDVNG